MRARLASTLATAVLLGGIGLTTACGNAGEDRVLSLQATGTVTGLVYLDRNGNRQPDGGNVDTGLVGVAVRLVFSGTRDTVARATTDLAGLFTMTAVPIGHYVMVVDTATVGDSVDVVRIDTSAVSLTRADSADTVRIAIGFPFVTVAQARLLPVGRRAFIQGVTLTSAPCSIVGCGNTFGDSTAHLADSTGAIRATRVKVSFGLATSFGEGDSVRFLGTRALLAGQASWDNVTPVRIAFGPFPPATTPPTITNATARTANGGALDAAFVRMAGDTIVDTATVLVGADSGDYRLTTVDGTDTLTVLLDKDAFLGFGAFLPDSVRTFRGLLVPPLPPAPLVWRLKPRSPGDVCIPGTAGC